MPSPIFLWRFKNLIEMDFQVFLFLVWAFICCKIGWDSLMRMSADKRDLFLYEAFLYFNQLLLVALMVWLWGINLWFFAQAGINYARIFDLDQNYLTHREIWKVTSTITLTYAIFCKWINFLQCCNGNRNVSGLIWTAATISVPIYSVLWNGFVLPLLSVLLLLSLV
nr:uncharacterized protein LOC112783660 [Arachis hypogaea]